MRRGRTIATALAIGLSFCFGCSAYANEELMRRSGCTGCHDINEKLIGPAYKDVAKKYRGDPGALAYLLHKVREGGEGVWGDMPMPPNETAKISDADLETLVQWILSL